MNNIRQVQALNKRELENAVCVFRILPANSPPPMKKTRPAC